MRRIRLMADYLCHPLWDLDQPRDVDPAELPLSDDLRSRLRSWATAYDRTLNQEYPPDSGFSSPEAEQAFESDGAKLWHDLARELGPAYFVSYYSQAAGAESTPTRSMVG